MEPVNQKSNQYLDFTNDTRMNIAAILPRTLSNQYSNFSGDTTMHINTTDIVTRRPCNQYLELTGTPDTRMHIDSSTNNSPLLAHLVYIQQLNLSNQSLHLTDLTIFRAWFYPHPNFINKKRIQSSNDGNSRYIYFAYHPTGNGINREEGMTGKLTGSCIGSLIVTYARGRSFANKNDGREIQEDIRNIFNGSTPPEQPVHSQDHRMVSRGNYSNN